MASGAATSLRTGPRGTGPGRGPGRPDAGLHPVAPVHDGIGEPVREVRQTHHRRHDVPPVPDQVDEPGVRHVPADEIDVEHVARGLVGVPGLAGLGREGPVQGGQRVRDGPEPLVVTDHAHKLGIELPAGERVVPLEVVEQSRPVEPGPRLVSGPAAQGRGDEVGLVWNGHQRVRIEHGPEHRRPRSTAADHEREHITHECSRPVARAYIRSTQPQKASLTAFLQPRCTRGRGGHQLTKATHSGADEATCTR